MKTGFSQSGSKGKNVMTAIRRLHGFVALRPYTIIMFGALFCTLAVKFFQSWRSELLNEYISWVLADIFVLLSMEVVLALVCFQWPRKWVVRAVTFIAALICAWSVINAGWLIRTGTQILPTVLLPLIRDPLNSLGIVGTNLIKMPKAACALLVPSALALTFFFHILAKPKLPSYNPKPFVKRIIISVIIIIIALVARRTDARRGSPQIVSAGLRFNSQIRAIESLILSDYKLIPNPKRKILCFDEIKIGATSRLINHNVVIIVLEGIQYKYTSLADKQNNLTPYLSILAEEGVEFVNTRSTVTHTTKALFALLTGQFPSTSQDIAETVPALKPYAGIVSILKEHLGVRSAFFQSAKGNFESRPGLVHNLDFDKFWSRDDLPDTNSYLAYLACDEFAMLAPITEWIKSDDKPFFLTVLCSVTHDPYEVPEWFGEPDKEPLERYKQTVRYTDKFLASLDSELAKLNLKDQTVFCVVGDHGEAFGEHGLLGHEWIAFDEALRVPFCLRAPSLVEPKTKITGLVSSVDFTPTLLSLLGFDISSVGFDGSNALESMPDDHKAYFTGWMQQGPAGFVQGSQKFIYNPTHEIVTVYDLSTDPLEQVRIELDAQQSENIANEITTWRNHNIFRLEQQPTGKKVVFDCWLCRWSNRICSAKYIKH